MSIEEANTFLKRYCEQQALECEEHADRIEKLMPRQVVSMEQKGLNEEHARCLREIAHTFLNIARDL